MKKYISKEEVSEYTNEEYIFLNKFVGLFMDHIDFCPSDNNKSLQAVYVGLAWHIFEDKMLDPIRYYCNERVE